MDMCKDCIKNNEPPASPRENQGPCPPGICPVCHFRYGGYIPICKMLTGKTPPTQKAK